MRRSRDGRLTNILNKAVVLVVSLFSVSILGWATISPAFADVILGGPQNCDSNAVIYCGASAASKVTADYNNGDGHNSAASIQNIYNYFGIGASAVQSLSSTAVAGSVTSGGNVYVNGQVVASGAVTAGRENIAGSSTATDNGTTFYVRPTSVSFASSSLSAYVVMSNGQFKFAILSSCGNPVKATATPKPTPPPAPKPAPSGVCTNLGLTQAAVNPRQVTASVAYTVHNGASLKAISYAWGDGTSSMVASPNTSATHSYRSDGNYKVTAAVSFNGTPSVPSADCSASLTITTIMPVCELLKVTNNSDTVTVTTFLYSKNTSLATFQRATLDWGDGSPLLQDISLIGQSHTYTNLTTHIIKATAYYTIAGKTVPVTSQSCEQVVTFVQPTASSPTPPIVTISTPPQPIPPQTQPIQLVNTGPGQVVAIFSGATILGTFGYRRFIRSRLS